MSLQVMNTLALLHTVAFAKKYLSTKQVSACWIRKSSKVIKSLINCVGILDPNAEEQSYHRAIILFVQF